MFINSNEIIVNSKKEDSERCAQIYIYVKQKKQKIVIVRSGILLK